MTTIPPGFSQLAATSSGIDGRFSTPIRDSIQDGCVLIDPPGLSKRIARVSWAEQGTGDETVQLPVGNTGGVLNLSYPRGKLPGERFALLFTPQCSIVPFSLRNFKEDGGRFTFSIPGVEAGEYSLCAVSYADLSSFRGGTPQFPGCVRGLLPAFGSLELTIP